MQHWTEEQKQAVGEMILTGLERGDDMARLLGVLGAMVRIPPERWPELAAKVEAHVLAREEREAALMDEIDNIAAQAWDEEGKDNAG
jgi:hypothetical protein